MFRKAAWVVYVCQKKLTGWFVSRKVDWVGLCPERVTGWSESIKADWVVHFQES